MRRSSVVCISRCHCTRWVRHSTYCSLLRGWLPQGLGIEVFAKFLLQCGPRMTGQTAVEINLGPSNISKVKVSKVQKKFRSRIMATTKKSEREGLSFCFRRVTGRVLRTFWVLFCSKGRILKQSRAGRQQPVLQNTSNDRHARCVHADSPHGGGKEEGGEPRRPRQRCRLLHIKLQRRQTRKGIVGGAAGRHRGHGATALLWGRCRRRRVGDDPYYNSARVLPRQEAHAQK